MPHLTQRSRQTDPASTRRFHRKSLSSILLKLFIKLTAVDPTHFKQETCSSGFISVHTKPITTESEGAQFAIDIKELCTLQASSLNCSLSIFSQNTGSPGNIPVNPVYPRSTRLSGSSGFWIWSGATQWRSRLQHQHNACRSVKGSVSPVGGDLDLSLNSNYQDEFCSVSQKSGHGPQSTW